MILLLILVLRVEVEGTLNRQSKIQPISIPALGRPFALGDLYDRKRDLIVPGPKIWSNEVLAKYTETPSHSTNFAVSTSNTVDDSCHKFDIHASLKASFLTGMISVSGSASYLQNKVYSNHQARVALKYRSTTFKRTIDPSTFSKPTYMSVLEKVTDATDVIAAIEYGAGAVFVFDSVLDSSESKRIIEGMLEVSVKKIPSFVIEGSGKVNISTADRELTDKFTCTFHGDFVLKEHPGNYEEAIKVYKNLPSLLGEKYKNSVPMKVWLYPIGMLPFSESTVNLHDIQENLITNIADEIEEMEHAVRKSNDILSSFVAEHHPRIRRNVADFREYIREYMMSFQGKLAVLLPKIRDGTEKNKALIELLDEKRKTPFNTVSLEKWISLRNQEVHVLKSISDLPNYCKDDGEFSSALLNDKEFTISLTLKLNTQGDNQLDAMKKYLHAGHGPSVEDFKHNVWWKPGQITLSRLQQFSAMIKAYDKIEKTKIKNGIQSNLQFAVREQILKSDSEKPEIIIDVYKHGKLGSPNVQIPANVNNVKIVSTAHDSVKLKWDAPDDGAQNVLYYVLVAYEPKTAHIVNNRSCDEFYCKVASVKTKLNNAEVNGLEAYKSYAFSVETYCSLGKSAESFKTNMVQTTKCPPGMYHTDPHHCKPCQPGEYADSTGSLLCLSCFQGTYTDKYNSPKCTQCPAGTYNDKMGRKSCVKCPEGTYSDYVGAFAPWWCKACPAGTYNSKEGQTSSDDCLKCARGSYSSNTGSVRCNSCPFGSQTKTTGCVSPSSCERGSGVFDKVVKSVSDVKKSSAATFGSAQARADALVDKSVSLAGSVAIAKTKLERKIDDVSAEAEKIFKTHYSEW